MTARIERTNLVQTRTGTRAPRAQEEEAYLERYRAPFSLRCGALLIDYIVLASIVAFSTLMAQLQGGGARTAGAAAEMFGFVAAVIVAFLDFIILAGWRGQTLGKWATGLRIERTDGTPSGFGRAAVRHIVGYPLSLLAFGLGFILAAFNAEGRALHDLIAGTVVVRDSGARRAHVSR